MSQGFTSQLPVPLPVAQGGTGLVSTTINQLLYSSGTNTIAGLATVNSAILTTNSSGVPGWTAYSTILPTIQTFTTGSGTYTTPTGVKYIIVEMVGGGGGAPGILAMVTAPTAGGNSTFGTSLLTANGGAVGGFSTAPFGGAGGTATISSPAVGIAVTGNAGNSGVGIINGTGGQGGAGFYGGSGIGQYTGIAGGNATGYGSGGGGSGGSVGSGSPGGGGAGGWLRALITTPSSTYSYTVGAGGAAGTNNNFNGGAGFAGVIFITEYY